MSKPVILATDKWINLQGRLQKDYPASVMMISWKCKEVLGFTVRTHNTFVNSRYVTDVRLDFYNEPKRTMFLLKYGEYVDRHQTSD